MNPITLPLNMPRCPDARQGDCRQHSTCARALVAHDIGRPLRDYTGELGWTARVCAFYLPAAAYRDGPAAPSPTVHDAPRGLV